MRSVNKVIIIGNLTRDPEVRQTPNGQTIVTFSIATNREWVTRDGRKQTSAEYHEVVAWAKLAEMCSKYLKKGKLVYVEGYLKTRNWDTAEGIKKFKTEIIVQDLIMLDKKKHDDDSDYVPLPENGTSLEEMETSNEEMENIPEPPKKQETAATKPQESSARPTSVDIDQDLGL